MRLTIICVRRAVERSNAGGGGGAKGWPSHLVDFFVVILKHHQSITIDIRPQIYDGVETVARLYR